MEDVFQSVHCSHLMKLIAPPPPAPVPVCLSFMACVLSVSVETRRAVQSSGQCHSSLWCRWQSSVESRSWWLIGMLTAATAPECQVTQMWKYFAFSLMSFMRLWAEVSVAGLTAASTRTYSLTLSHDTFSAATLCFLQHTDIYQTYQGKTMLFTRPLPQQEARFHWYVPLHLLIECLRVSCGLCTRQSR